MTVDPELIKRCIKNDERAQNQLFKLCFPLLMGICMRYYNNEPDALNALNKGFYRILTKLKQHDTTKQFEAWAKRIMITTILNELKANKKNKDHYKPVDFDDPINHNDHNFDHINEQINADAILDLIRELPEKEKEVLNLYAIDGYNHKEISALIDIPEGTSKWLLSSARKKLTQSMAKLIKSGIKSMLL